MTVPSIPVPLAKALRHELAAAVARTSAYDVPHLCRRIGLADGEGSEAFAGKYKYVERRLFGLSIDDVLDATRKLLAEEEHFALGEVVAQIRGLGSHPVSELTRRRLISLLSEQRLSTVLSDIDLLKTVWPANLVTDPAADMMEALRDFTGQDGLADRRNPTKPKEVPRRALLESVGLLTCSCELLFRFLEKVTSPEVQSEKQQAFLAARIDQILRKDGYMLVAGRKIAGSPTYLVKELLPGSPADKSISETLSAFDPTQVHARWEAALERRSSEPEGAITLARTLLEDVCKWILDNAGETWEEKDDLPSLYRKLAKTLKLAPDDHTEEVFKKILGSCQNIVESLGSLRNKLGDAHSAGPKRARPQPRHAELSVNLAGAMATFLVSTWEARKVEAREKTTKP